MSEVRWADNQVQQAEDRRQIEKSEEEKAKSKASFEKRLHQDKTTKQQSAKSHAEQSHAQKTAQDSRHLVGRQQQAQQAAQKTQAQQTAGQDPRAAQQQAKENHVLAHVRQQAAQQGARGMERLRGGALGEQVQQAARDAEGAAANSQEAGRGLLGNRDQALKSGTAQEKDRTRELQDKDRVQEKDSDSVKEQGKAEGAQQTNQAQQAQGAQGQAQLQVDQDSQRRQQQQQQQQQQQGGQQQQPGQVSAQEATKGPSAQALKRANKAAEIQKLCEKLLDNFYLGAAPDGSAMMRMELKEGVLAGLVIELKVDDKRKVKLTLSGNKEAADFVVSSRGELARALTRKGLILEDVKAN